MERRHCGEPRTSRYLKLTLYSKATAIRSVPEPCLELTSSALSMLDLREHDTKGRPRRVPLVVNAHPYLDFMSRPEEALLSDST